MDKRVRQGCVFAHRSQTSPFPLSLNSSIVQKGEGAGILLLVNQEERMDTHQSRLTPDLTLLPERPIILPFFPDPLRARTPFSDFAVVGFDCGEDGGGNFVIIVGVSNDQRRDIEGECLGAGCTSSNRRLRQAPPHRNG